MITGWSSPISSLVPDLQSAPGYRIGPRQKLAHWYESCTMPSKRPWQPQMPRLGFPQLLPPRGKVSVFRNWTTVPRESGQFIHLLGMRPNHWNTTPGSTRPPQLDAPAIGLRTHVTTAKSSNSTATEEFSQRQSILECPRREAPPLLKPATDAGDSPPRQDRFRLSRTDMETPLGRPEFSQRILQITKCATL